MAQRRCPPARPRLTPPNPAALAAEETLNDARTTHCHHRGVSGGLLRRWRSIAEALKSSSPNNWLERVSFRGAPMIVVEFEDVQDRRACK